MVKNPQVWDALNAVQDPEFPLSIVDLGMVYGVQVNGGAVKIDLTFTSIGCPAIEMIISDIKEAVNKIKGVSSADVEIVWSPPWTKDKITEKGKQILQCYGVS